MNNPLFQHDATIMSLLSALNIFNVKAPPFAATMMVELYNNSGQYSVQIHYRNDSNTEPYLLQIPGMYSVVFGW